MLHLLFALPVVFLLSCSSKSETEQVHELNKWAGRPVAEILKHDYFKNLPKKEKSYEDGSHVILFTDQSKFQTGAYCQSLGGCVGLPSYNCQHLVKYRDEKIIGIEQNGTCPDSKTTRP